MGYLVAGIVIAAIAVAIWLRTRKSTPANTSGGGNAGKPPFKQ